MNKFTIEIEGYGSVTVTAWAMDDAIQRYLPASAFDLRELIKDRTGEEYRVPVSAMLAMLADFDHNVDGDPIAATR